MYYILSLYSGSWRKSKLHNWFRSSSVLIDAFGIFFTLRYFNVFLLPLAKVTSQIDQLQKYSLGKSNKSKLVSEFDIFIGYRILNDSVTQLLSDTVTQWYSNSVNQWISKSGNKWLLTFNVSKQGGEGTRGPVNIFQNLWKKGGSAITGFQE